MNYSRSLIIFALILTACGGTKAPAPSSAPAPTGPVGPPTVTVTQVSSQELNRQLHLPGELQAFEDVALFARVPAYVDSITVDRGSAVRKGQLLIHLKAAELDTQRSEAEARVRVVQSQKTEAISRIASIKAQRLEAQARVSSDESTYRRMKAASATPGAVAGNDLEIAQHTVEASRARLQVWEENERAAEAQSKALEEGESVLKEAARSQKNIEDYLRIVAPFDGVVAERNVHPGSLAGTNSGGTLPLLRIQQITRLRLIISVPESTSGRINRGAKISFTVPAFPGESFNGAIRRIGSSLDPRTRTLPVELDVENKSGRLAPGMLPDVVWPISRPHLSLFVPATAVAVTTERIFVIRIKDGIAEWVDVKRGSSMNQQGIDIVEVFGGLNEGDQVVVRGTDELRNGTKVNAKPQK